MVAFTINYGDFVSIAEVWRDSKHTVKWVTELKEGVAKVPGNQKTGCEE